MLLLSLSATKLLHSVLDDSGILCRVSTARTLIRERVYSSL
jgi:hypothetical protein